MISSDHVVGFLLGFYSCLLVVVLFRAWTLMAVGNPWGMVFLLFAVLLFVLGLWVLRK